MDNKELKCIVEMFSNSTICYEDDSIIVVPNEILADVLIKDCYSLEYDTIHLFGNENYINGIINNLKITEETQFSKNNIRIEVN